jgi:uncharacterized protein (TIGR00730 family)
MTAIRRLAVFCGSSTGDAPAYAAAARELGTTLARRGIGLVYGGASVGLMGTVADAAIAAGGEVIGVIPEALVRKEVAHGGPVDLRIVGSMHERKALMAELGCGFVALPGGIGTLEELFEVWTWAQLGYHAKPCALLNVDGFYDPLIAFLEGVVAHRFLKDAHRSMLIVADAPDDLLARLAAYEPPVVGKWLAGEDT